MEEKSKKQAIILSVVAVVTLIILVVGATYAYFSAQGGSATSTNLNVTTYTTDVFTFAAGDEINLEITQSNFASGKGNAVGSTFASATLTANNKTNTATEHYYLYLNIENNDFEYTVNNTTPELMLTVTDSEGNEVTDIAELTHTTVTDASGKVVSGYDITTKSGLLTLFNNREITATPKKEEKWNITITFVNLDADQTKNANKSLNAKVMIQKEKITLLVDYVKSLYTGTQGKNNIYYHDASLTNGAGDNSFRYAGGDYVLTEVGKATGATMMIGDNEMVTTALIDFYCDGTKQYVGYADHCITQYYLIKGDTTRYQTYKETLNKALEKGYLTKDNVKNFVCFGSTETPCPTENLYRIIGVFEDKVKLIKYDYANSNLLGTDGDYYNTDRTDALPYMGSLSIIDTYHWNNSTSTNTWSESLLNKTNLNTNFINNIGSEWANKIATTMWKVGGNTYANIKNAVPSVAYQNEVVNPVMTNSTDNATEYSAKIGLMYVSDYGFAAEPSAWTMELVEYNRRVNDSVLRSLNWMYTGFYEWSVSRLSDTTNSVLRVRCEGEVQSNEVYYNSGARPTFYLTSSVTYVSGDGTSSNPYRIN